MLQSAALRKIDSWPDASICPFSALMTNARREVDEARAVLAQPGGLAFAADGEVEPRACRDREIAGAELDGVHLPLFGRVAEGQGLGLAGGFQGLAGQGQALGRRHCPFFQLLIGDPAVARAVGDAQHAHGPGDVLAGQPVQFHAPGRFALGRGDVSERAFHAHHEAEQRLLGRLGAGAPLQDRFLVGAQRRPYAHPHGQPGDDEAADDGERREPVPSVSRCWPRWMSMSGP